MNISSTFIERPIATSLLMAAIVLFGLVAYRSLPVSDLPNVDFPTLLVTASLPGASPETMASAVATPLENQFSMIAGLNAMTSTNSLGATQITMTDVSPQRLEMARKLGATRTVNVAETPLATVRVEADVLIECSGNQKALIDGIRSLRPAGKAVVVGMSPGEEVSVPMAFLQNLEITLTGTFRYANTYADAIELVATGHIDLKPIITGHYALEETEQALQATKHDPANIKSIVEPKQS